LTVLFVRISLDIVVQRICATLWPACTEGTKLSAILAYSFDAHTAGAIDAAYKRIFSDPKYRHLDEAPKRQVLERLSRLASAGEDDVAHLTDYAMRCCHLDDTFNQATFEELHRVLRWERNGIQTPGKNLGDAEVGPSAR
jgi:hypothetical protein